MFGLVPQFQYFEVLHRYLISLVADPRYLRQVRQHSGSRSLIFGQFFEKSIKIKNIWAQMGMRMRCIP